MSIMVIGGAGYIGSHTVKYLIEQGEDVVVVDNLSLGHVESLKGKCKLYQVDIRNGKELQTVFEKEDIQGVIHFAACSLVGESMEEPYKYYNNNVYGMMELLKVMDLYKVKNIVFSSTAATYGEPKNIPISEDDETEPTNPYGETKLAMEKMIRWFNTAYGFNYVSLRYFNAAGASPDGEIGEAHSTETHLIPLVLQVPLGKRESISIFGDDYPTKDGTCIRDYIHVMDLAQAHYLAYKHIINGGESTICNLGSGDGYSVQEVIDVCRKVTGHEIPAIKMERRPGDPAILIASSEKAKRVLGWKPEFLDLETIVKDAWKWHKNNPNGYKKQDR